MPKELAVSGKMTAPDIIAALVDDDRSADSTMVAKRLGGFAQDDARGFHAIMRAMKGLSDDAALHVRSAVVDRLGNVDEDQDDFKLAEFASQWSSLSSRAKALLFGKDHRAYIDRIAAADPDGATGKALAKATPAMIAHPRASSWLSGLTRKPNAGAVRAHVKKLSKIATESKAVAPDLHEMEKALA